MERVSASLRRVFDLLALTQPIPDETDLAWWGPYFIPSRGQWHPTHFTLYQGTLYCRLLIPPSSYGLSWAVGAGEVEFERGFSTGDYDNNEHLWAEALAQIERRLRSALKDFDRYNRMVERRLPRACRTGKLQRRLSWPKKARAPLPRRRIQRLEEVLRSVRTIASLQSMTLSRYLRTVAIAYDAVFKELRPLRPLEKYKRRADGRHGGLLELPPDDGEAFAGWFHSSRWLGTHPWEIVFGHPHGIMIAPRHEREADRWKFELWVDSVGWYADAARMALALGESQAAFEFRDQEKVLAALTGSDEVELGPDLYAIHYDDLKEKRPDSLPSIRWEPIPMLGPITPDQAARIPRAMGRRAGDHFR